MCWKIEKEKSDRKASTPMSDNSKDIQRLKDKYAEFVPSETSDRNGEDFYMDNGEGVWQPKKEVSIKVTDKSIAEWSSLMCGLRAKCWDIGKQISELYQLMGQIQDMQLGMCKCFPAEYDGGKLVLAYYFEPVFVKKSEHWSYRNINKNERNKYREAYVYARNLWKQMTEGIEAYNFKVGMMADESKVWFKFTVANVPGKFEVCLPNRDQYGPKQRDDLAYDSLMQIVVTYASATMASVWNAVGKSYHIEDIPTIIKKFVNEGGYKKYFPQDFVERKCLVEGKEFVIEEKREIPQEVWDRIDVSRREASVEKEPKDCQCEQCGKPITATEYQCGGCVCFDCAIENMGD